MKTMRSLYLLWVLAALLGVGLFFTPPADAVKIHALLIIQDDASNYEQHEASGEAMGKLIRKVGTTLGCSVEQTRLNTDPDPDDASKYASSANVLKWVSELRPNNDDIVWVYYSGHGGVKSDHFTIVLGGNESFHRNRLVDRMDELGCRLKILMTDSCSYSGEPVTYVNPSDLDAYRHLFLEHKGFFNVTAASKGEIAGGSQSGGWFTRGIFRIIDHPGRIDLDADDFITWEEVFKEISRVTNELFEESKSELSEYWKSEIERIGQKGQNPIFFGDLPKRISQ